MITKNGITSTPDSGSGVGTVSFKAATINRGNRVTQKAIFYVNATGVTDPSPVEANHVAAAEFVNFDFSTKSVDKVGGNITLTGKTNSTKLTFSLAAGGSIVITLPNSYSAGGQNTNNAAIIAGDPGAAAQFAFSIVISVPENTTIVEKVKQVIVTANGGQSSTCELLQASGDPFLNVSPTTINVPQDGTAVSVTVTSNTSWTIT